MSSLLSDKGMKITNIWESTFFRNIDPLRMISNSSFNGNVYNYCIDELIQNIFQISRTRSETLTKGGFFLLKKNKTGLNYLP